VIVADTSGLLAFFNEQEPSHTAVRSVLESDRDPVVVSPYVVAELDYLLATRVGVEAEITVLSELASGAYLLPAMEASELMKAVAVLDRYRSLHIGVTEASLVVLAERFRSRSLLTLDRRHFEAL